MSEHYIWHKIRYNTNTGTMGTSRLAVLRVLGEY